MSTDGCCVSVLTVPLLQFPLCVWLDLNVNTSSIIMVDMNYYSNKYVGYGFGVMNPSLFLLDDVY